MSLWPLGRSGDQSPPCVKKFPGLCVTAIQLQASVYLTPSVADRHPSPAPAGPNTSITIIIIAVVVAVEERRADKDKSVPEEPVSGVESIPESKPISTGREGTGRNDPSEAAGMTDSGTTNAVPAKSTVSHATTLPVRRTECRTGCDGRHRGQRDHHLAHHILLAPWCELRPSPVRI